MNLIQQAMKFATEEHVTKRGQLYANLLPYTHHPQTVAQILRDYGLDDEVMQVAAWLHDIVEDTDIRIRDITELFGQDVAVLVEAVTSEPGPNRKTRNALTYPKIRATGPRAIALKLADRVANVSFGGNAISMYKKEHADFRHGIYLTQFDMADKTERAIAGMQEWLDYLIDH